MSPIDLVFKGEWGGGGVEGEGATGRVGWGMREALVVTEGGGGEIHSSSLLPSPAWGWRKGADKVVGRWGGGGGDGGRWWRDSLFFSSSFPNLGLEEGGCSRMRGGGGGEDEGCGKVQLAGRKYRGNNS